MQIKSLGMMAVSVVALAACNSTSPQQPTQPSHVARPAEVATFECDIGLDAQVRYLDSDRIEISIDNRRAVLSSAVAGSGERYVGTTGLWGHGGEWHQKGDLAFFSYTGLHGAKGDSKCQRVYR